MEKTFKALADPTRREILRMLNEKSLAAGEIAEAFGISKPSLSHHLNILKNAELVSAERHGQHIIYSINASVVQEFLQYLLDFFQVGDEAGREAQSEDKAPGVDLPLHFSDKTTNDETRTDLKGHVAKREEGDDVQI